MPSFVVLAQTASPGTFGPSPALHNMWCVLGEQRIEKNTVGEMRSSHVAQPCSRVYCKLVK